MNNGRKRVYFDHAATTQLSEKAFLAMLPYLKEHFHNPSTLYSSARVTRKAIAESRHKIARFIGADFDEIIFTSGGSESDNWAVKNILFSNNEGRKKIVTSCIEHHAVIHSCQVMEKLGYSTVYLPVDEQGIISVECLEKEMDDNVAIVSIMFANNEIGTIQDIKALSSIAHKYGALFHTDAVQAVGHIDIHVKELGIDLLSASAHKFNGPKGIGFLYVNKNTELSAFINGGGQEYGMRAGTENVAGIVGMAVALEENMSSLYGTAKYLFDLERIFLDRLKEYNVDFIVNGSTNKIPGNISLSIFGAEGEVLLHRLDLKGFEVATGSACNSTDTELSHVISAVKVPEKYANGTIRISLGKENTEDDVMFLAKAIYEITSKIQR